MSHTCAFNLAFVFSYSSRISFQTLSGRTKAFVLQPFAEIETVNMDTYLRFRANIKLVHQALMVFANRCGNHGRRISRLHY